MKVLSSPPTLEPLALLPQLNLLPKLEPISLPQSSEIRENSKQIASAVADRLISEIVTEIQPVKSESEIPDAAFVANVFETKVKLVEQKVKKHVEELKEMPEKVINDTIQKLSLELNSATNDVLSALNSAEETVKQVESFTSSQQTPAVKSENIAAPVESLKGIIESIPVALNNVAANIAASPLREENDSVPCLALQLDSLGFDFEETEMETETSFPVTNEVALPEVPSSNSAPSPPSSLPPAGFGVVAGKVTNTDDGTGCNENGDGNDSGSKSKSGGNKKNRNKNRRNKNKCTFFACMKFHFIYHSLVIIFHSLP